MKVSSDEMHKILDDLKRVSRLVPILRDEKDTRQKERIGTLMIDELQKLTDDIAEMRNETNNNR